MSSQVPPLTRIVTLGRRGVMRNAAAATATALLPNTVAGNQPVYAGAIRWDAWDAVRSNVSIAVAASLAPLQLHGRAPFCATEHGDSVDFEACNTQDVMEAEIAAASAAGISYWAYCWYGPSDSMMAAWSLHQSSPNRNSVNWCLLLQFSRLSGFASRIPAYLAYFRQPNYQRVLGSRPLVYLYVDQLTHLASDWGGNWANLRAILENLAVACVGVGVNRPYLVILSGNPSTARDIMTALAGDAISNYIGRIASGRPAPYTALDTTTQSYWAEMAATGAPVIPICMTGWDARPRKLHPPPWDHNQKPGVGMDTYVTPGTPAQIAAHINSAIAYIDTHPATCPARTLLIYSWDECDEGGSPLIPTYTASGPNHAILDAVGTVLRTRKGN